MPLGKANCPCKYTPTTPVPKSANQPSTTIPIQGPKTKKVQENPRSKSKAGRASVIQRYSRRFLPWREIARSTTMSKTAWRVCLRSWGTAYKCNPSRRIHFENFLANRIRSPLRRRLQRTQHLPRIDDQITATFRMDPRPGASRINYEGVSVWAMSATAGCEPKKYMKEGHSGEGQWSLMIWRVEVYVEFY